MLGGIEFKDVARLLTCEQFAEAEGMKMRGRRTVCPFHAGADGYNLAFNSDGTCHCFRCNVTRDVVALAAAVWRMNQRDAAVELNQRFNLGLTGERLTAADLARRDAERRRQRALRDAEKQAETREWSTVADTLREAEYAAACFTIEDAEKPATWAAIARWARAQEKWFAMGGR